MAVAAVARRSLHVECWSLFGTTSTRIPDSACCNSVSFIIYPGYILYKLYSIYHNINIRLLCDTWYGTGSGTDAATVTGAVLCWCFRSVSE